MTPRISIITITYNCEATVEETIRSVVSQGYDGLEYIIIDGGSTDKTLEIVDKYRSQIAVVVSEPDKGISDAFNKGIQRATGEIIGIINADDILLPDTLKRLASHYDQAVDVYSGNVLAWDDKTGNTFREHPDVRFDTMKLQYNVAHSSRFIRKSAYDRYGLFVVEMKYNMDIELLCRFYRKGAVFLYVDEDWTQFRLGGTTATPIYKKKADYRYFVESFGGSKWDFRKLWLKAIVKYNLIRLGFLLFGEDIRFKIRNNAQIDKLVNRVNGKLF